MVTTATRERETEKRTLQIQSKRSKATARIVAMALKIPHN